jgi:pimeloyl-ACP methyl ester carboxylesterase
MRMRTADHTFTVPLDHANPDGEQIQVYGREVRLADGADRPWLVFLQGGPGGKSPRPAELDGWLARAVKDFTVLLLDQRGTGRSTPANRLTLVDRTPEDQARYLGFFRADAIVADCERIRRELLGETRWSVLGQSYGGFCAATYLSFAPEGLDRVHITGGIPPLTETPDEIYRTTYPKVLRRNDIYYRRYPDDEPVLAGIRDHLLAEDVRLPGGDRLVVRRLQWMGQHFGMVGGYEQLHFLVEEAWARPGVLSDVFLESVEHATSFADRPIYALLHEAAYTQGFASDWSAQRILAEFPACAPEHPRLHFTGEMIYPWMFESYGQLAPLREAADILARRADWAPLYDVERLRGNEVPVAATVYHDDLYVARELSLRSAESIGALDVWVTNEYEHDGLRRDGERVLDRLFEMTTR